MAKNIAFNIHLSINGQDVIVRCKKGIQDLGKALGTIPTGASKAGQALQVMGSVSASLQGAYSGLQTITSALGSYIDKANAATESQTKLTTVMRQRMAASNDDVSSINSLISAQTKLGVVGGTVQRSGLQQLATFASQRKTLETLLPAMNNLLVQQNGLNATSESAVGVANLMGKALMGNYSALKRVGITFTDAQAELIKYGDEETRAATIANVITQNVGNMNAEMANTDAGKAKKAANEIGGLQVKLGQFFSQYQSVIMEVGQVGSAITGLAQLGNGIIGTTKALFSLTTATSIASFNNKVATATVRAFTTAIGMSSVSITGASIAVKALTWAIRGLEVASVIGAIIAGLSIAFDALVGSADKASDANKRLADSTSSERAQVKDARAELEKNIAMTKNFKGSKDQEKVIVDKLNNTYGDTLGYFSNVHDWYNALIKDSKSYCDQLIIEAENRKLANQAADIDEKIYDIRYDKSGKPKKYSTAKTTKRTPVLDKNGLQVLDPNGTPLYNYSQGPSQLDNKNAELNQLRSQRDNIRRRMNGNENRRRNIRIPVRGSDNRPNSIATDNTPANVAKTGHTTPTTSANTVVYPKGSIAQFNQQLDVLRKKRDQLTDPESIANVDDEIRKLTSDIENLNMSAREIGLKRSEKSLGIEKFEPTNLGSFTPTLDDKALSESLDNIKEKWNETFKEMKENAESEAEAIAQAVQGIRSSLGGDVTQTIAEWQELGKCFKQGGDAATGAGGAMVLVGQQMQQIAGDGAAAKVGAIMAAIGQLVLGYATASAQAADLGPFGWIGFAIAGAATLASIISQVSSFSTGGIVGGTSYNGDKVPARVNSGEMILTMRQQKRLFSIANGDIMPKVGLPSYQSVSPSLHTAGSLAAIPLDITIHGKTRGADTLYTLQNVRRRDAKFGKRWD